jgi:hypothetical protein
MDRVSEMINNRAADIVTDILGIIQEERHPDRRRLLIEALIADELYGAQLELIADLRSNWTIGDPHN